MPDRDEAKLVTIVETPSPNFNDRTLPVSMLVMHYTGMVDGASAIRRLTSSNAGVSAHYVVNEDGTVLRLVDEGKRAWHAGVSYWRGITDVNSASIGIEIVNPGHEFGYRPFPADQVAAVVRLTDEIRKRHDIPRANVVGHSDVAPSRKQDPGELFPWDKLARLGHALAVPKNATVDPGWTDSAFLVALERFGYDIEDKLAVVVAFQRRFRPELIDGTIDGQSRAILFRLLLDREQGEAR
ncbi:N-acetylmuramoyl-L-alanine amidase [Parasphingopyxis sp. CP4]|uniref:N-acetylmuramoyl-L-alanine amidase n=1 Tax=Parasphingopyxis sp. CP4 TaxID=2724527 RepID=UPI0015A164D8|nr:N-acetylmuramoyl-L-alanine amidase [Parasphingopyxis sp. CP4]QLC21613.1 N-acetylmuramoyl-L-alanine amidase [Parasphingopyxis sp. CP4]